MLFNETGNLHFTFENTEEDGQIPLVIFDYTDLQYFKNLPNFNAFMNHTYLDDKKFLDIGDDQTDPITFDFKLFRNQQHSNRFFTKIITDDEEFDYPIQEPGQYCVYLPLYSYDGDIIHPTNYKGRVSIEEFQSISVYNDISAHISITIMFGLIIIPLSYLFPQIRTRHYDKLPPVVQQMVQLLLTNLFFNVAHFVLELIYLFIPNDYAYAFTELIFATLKDELLTKWQIYLMASIYLGIGYKNLPASKQGARKVLQLALTINIIAKAVLNYLLKETSTVQDILINNEPYQITHKSILVHRFYRNIVTFEYPESTKRLITLTSTISLATLFTIRLISYYSGIRLAWYLRKDTNLSRPMVLSLILHLVAWCSFGRQIIYQLYVRIMFGGLFDVGELLSVLGTQVENYEVMNAGLQVTEILLILFIWYPTRPYDVEKYAEEQDALAKEQKRAERRKGSIQKTESAADKKVKKVKKVNNVKNSQNINENSDPKADKIVKTEKKEVQFGET